LLPLHRFHSKNMKFWEELISSFPSYDTGHIENDASNNSSGVACVFVTAVTFLPSHCLATIGRFLPSRCLAMIGGLSTSRCLATIGDTHTDAKNDGRDLLIRPMRWVQVRSRDIRTKFHKDWFWHSKVNGGGYTYTQTSA
jgi:hypothetical protein